MANTTGKKFGGRKKGTPNRTTTEIRQAFQTIINSNIDNLDVWLNQVAEKNPEKAIFLLLELAEYVIPKFNKKDIYEEPKDEFDNMTEEELDEELRKNGLGHLIDD